MFYLPNDAILRFFSWMKTHIKKTGMSVAIMKKWRAFWARHITDTKAKKFFT